MGAKIGGNDKLGVWGLGLGVVFLGLSTDPKLQTPNPKLQTIHYFRHTLNTLLCRKN